MAAISILTPMLSLMPIIKKKKIRSKEMSQVRDNGKIEKLRVQRLIPLKSFNPLLTAKTEISKNYIAVITVFNNIRRALRSL